MGNVCVIARGCLEFCISRACWKNRIHTNVSPVIILILNTHTHTLQRAPDHVSNCGPARFGVICSFLVFLDIPCGDCMDNVEKQSETPRPHKKKPSQQKAHFLKLHLRPPKSLFVHCFLSQSRQQPLAFFLYLRNKCNDLKGEKEEKIRKTRTLPRRRVKQVPSAAQKWTKFFIENVTRNGLRSRLLGPKKCSVLL